jgi:outer membrane protein, heavy metal efflux system
MEWHNPCILALMNSRSVLSSLVMTVLAGCSVPGEEAEREALEKENKPYRVAHDRRPLPELPGQPLREAVLQYAFYSNAAIEQAYFEWAMALERVPQASSLENPRFSFEYLFSRDRVARWDRVTLGASQMVPFPGKLEAAGQVALQAAVAARRRFENEKFSLQAEVIEAYEDLALTDRSIAVGESNLALLRQFVEVSRARVGAGQARQAELTKAELEVGQAENELTSIRARRGSDLARINRLLSRPPASPLVPATAAEDPPLPAKDDELLALAGDRNREIAALAAEVQGQEHALDLARKAWLPDFEVSFDVRGSMERMLGAMITLPFQAGRIQAGIREAQAGIRAAQAALRNRADDVRARLVLNAYLARDGDRQVRLFRKTLIPKAREIVEATREAYGAGSATFLDLLDAQRALLALELETARMDAMRRQAVARLEALCALDFGALPRSKP